MENNPTQIKELQQLFGKTIDGAFYSDSKIFLFLNGNLFALFRSDYDYDCELVSSEYKLEPNTYNFREYQRMGLISKEEADNIMISFQEKQKNEIRNAEIKRLKELKEKYPEI